MSRRKTIAGGGTVFPGEGAHTRGFKTSPGAIAREHEEHISSLFTEATLAARLRKNEVAP